MHALTLVVLMAGWGRFLPVSSREVVRDGEAEATVVVAANASEQLVNAVDVLVGCIEESTGVRLSVAAEPPSAGTVIHVGPSPAVDAFGIDQAGLDADGFDIAFPGRRHIVILGPTDWGTEFGVYEFLERYVGVRWLLPGEDGTDIPRCEAIRIKAQPVRQEPAFMSRLFSGLSGKAQTDWARRNRMRGRISFHHNLIRLFPPETYTQTHPEFFPIHDGKRFLPETNSTHRWQPCYCAPGLAEEAIANIVKFFDQNPEVPSYSLGANDSSGYCQCEQCMARISGEKNFLNRVDYSDLYYDWANRVIEGVLEKHPDKYFGCLAYSEVAAPPATVDVHSRMIPYMTYDRMKWVDAELREVGEELTRQWHAKSPTLGWYDYIYGTPYVLPRVWFHHMADYYRFGHANGVRALYAEAYPNWGEGPKLYVSLKLQWDPTQDVDALLAEWFERCVGRQAAPYLAAYYAHWEDFWTRRVLESKWFSKGGQYLSFFNPLYLRDIEVSEIERSRELLEKAVAKADTEQRRARAQLLLDAFEYYEATAYAYKAGTVPDDQSVMTEEQALRIIDSAVQSHEYVRKRRVLAREVFPEHPVLRHPIGIERSNLLSGDSWASGSLWQVFDWVASSDGPVRERIRTMARAADCSLVRGQAQMMLELINNTLDPLTLNPSFEQGSGAQAEHWTWWVKWGTGSMRRTDEVAHSGAYSVLCEGMKRGGPVQELNITPGKYALVCFVYLPPGQESKGTTELAMTLRNPNGKNLPSSACKILPEPGRWTAMAVAAEVPATIGNDEVKSVMPMLIVDGFEPGEKVYFDDLMLYRIAE